MVVLVATAFTAAALVVMGVMVITMTMGLGGILHYCIIITICFGDLLHTTKHLFL
jgi:hypothetical protein